MTDDRAQAFTLEGIVSGVIVLTALLFALQTVSVAPATTGTTDDASTLRTQANDLISVAADEGYLKRMVLCGKQWNTTAFTGEDVSPYRAIGNDKEDILSGDPGGPLKQSATPFGDMIRVALTDRGYNFRLEFAYLVAPGNREVMSVFPHGDGAGDNPRPASRDPAVVATHTVTLFDNMETTGITDATASSGKPTQKFCNAGMPGQPSGVPLKDVAKNDDDTTNAEFYLEDIDDDSDLFNVVEVRLVVW